MRHRLLDRIAGGNLLASLPSTMQTVMCRRRQPVGQNREGLLARPTDSAPHPEGSALIIVALTESLSVADDRVVAADRTSPRQKDQRDHPGVDVVIRLWQCDKKNQAGMKARPLTVPCQSFDLPLGLHPPVKSASNEKRISRSIGSKPAVSRPDSQYWPLNFGYSERATTVAALSE
jgi:hypothetical protein